MITRIPITFYMDLLLKIDYFQSSYLT